MATTSQENAALVRQFLAEVVAGGDTAAVETFVTDDWVDTDLVFGAADACNPSTSLARTRLAAADVAVDIERTVATDEAVAVLATVTGTHAASLVDLDRTGETFEIACAWFCHIDDGEIAEVWTLPDGLGLVRQLGAIPPVAPDSTEQSNRQPSKRERDT